MRTAQQIPRSPYKRGGTASMIVGSVCREMKNPNLRADDPAIMRAMNEHFEELSAERDAFQKAWEAEREVNRRREAAEERKRGKSAAKDGKRKSISEPVCK